MATFVLLFPLQLIYAPPPPNHNHAFDYAEHVLIGKILSVEILSEPYVQITANTGSTITGIALYEVQVEKYLKNPLDTNIIKVYGYYVNDEHVRSGFDLLYDVDEKVFLYIQTDPHNALDGYDLIIRSYESRSIDRMGPICDASDTFYHKGECKEIPDCPSNTIFTNGVCNIINGGCEHDIDGNIPIPEPLTKDEESRILNIIQNDSMINSIMVKGNWHVAFVSPAYDNGVKTGGVAHIVFDKSIWFEGTYMNPPTKQEHSAKLWLGAMDIFVNFNTNSVLGMDPGVGKPSGVPPVSVEHLQAKNNAQAKAIGELKRSDITAKLLAIYQTPETPQGIAFYMIDSTEGNELTVGVDLSNNQIVDKYTIRVIKELRN